MYTNTTIIGCKKEDGFNDVSEFLDVFALSDICAVCRGRGRMDNYLIHCDHQLLFCFRSSIIFCISEGKKRSHV